MFKKDNLPKFGPQSIFQVIKIYNTNPTPLCDSVNIEQKKNIKK